MPDETKILYAIPMMIASQKSLLDKYCFGSCGKIKLGAIDIQEVGPCWICAETNCPYEKGHTEIIGTSEISGESVCIRGMSE